MADVQALYPAPHYVMVDDKPRIHAALKQLMKDRITTVQVLQGKYAREPQAHSPRPDRTIATIGGFVALEGRDLFPAPAARSLGFPARRKSPPTGS